MKILVDIVHPADVLFFFNPIKRWAELGHTVAVVSREKDVTQTLLVALGIEHQLISRAGTNLLSLGLELIQRDLALLAVARKFRPDVMCGFGGVAISHVGKLLRKPSVSFYDTERAPLQNTLTLPFITHLYVPESYDGPVARNRTTHFPGTKDFSYLHPDNFSPDHTRAVAAGLDPDARNYFIRLVRWQANHDMGRSGWQQSTLIQLVNYLSGRGKVHISSESGLSPQMAKFQYRGAVQDVHHLLAYCECYIGESATMAGEAVLLGVPAVYATPDRRCYTDELAASQLLWKLPRVDIDALRAVLEEIEGLERGEWERRVGNYLLDKINLANYVVEVTLRHAELDRNQLR